MTNQALLRHILIVSPSKNAVPIKSQLCGRLYDFKLAVMHFFAFDFEYIFSDLYDQGPSDTLDIVTEGKKHKQPTAREKKRKLHQPNRSMAKIFRLIESQTKLLCTTYSSFLQSSVLLFMFVGLSLTVGLQHEHWIKKYFT